MAEWRPLHQSLHFRSGLETGGQSYDPPLLPYEKSLIAALDCSEEEYKKFVRYAMQRAHVRPAEYAHIPDINAIVLVSAGVKTAAGVFLTNLAIGVALTAASLLLAPKAPSFEDSASRKIKGKKLADQIGPSSFNQTTSFDNVPSLAELNQPIPIPFGDTSTGADDETTGGLILVPALVWSRVYAYGTYQAFEGIYVVGEQGITFSPEEAGILLGTSSLSSLGNADFAFYWSSKSGRNRPKDLLYGSEGPGPTGTVGREIFTAPTDTQFSKGFSMTYVPSGDTTFGTSTPIHNGTAYRFNWQVISAPFSATKGSDNRDAREEIQAKRRKIAGKDADNLHERNEQSGQPGVGRAYSRHMGFIAYRGPLDTEMTIYSDKTELGVDPETPSVEPGGIAVFEIDNSNSEWERIQEDEEDGFKGTTVNLKDLINEATAWRDRASELLVVGTKWIVGSSAWIVTQREIAGDAIRIHMECTAVLGLSTFGIAGTRAVGDALAGYEGSKFNDTKHCGANFYTLCGLKRATIRPVRRDTEVIELGIRSTVFNRANGLCNFNEIPTPNRLFDLDEDDISLTTGQMNKYFARSSFFSLYVRLVSDASGAESDWHKMPAVFCVQGRTPVAQINYLRINPRVKGYYEYRLIPRTGAEIQINEMRTAAGQQDPGTEILDVYLLQATEGTPYLPGAAVPVDLATDLGEFRITFQGKKISIRDVIDNPELFTNPSLTRTEVLPATIPTALVPIGTDTDTKILNLHKFAWHTYFLGDPASFSVGHTETVQYTHYKTTDAVGTRTVVVEISGTIKLGKTTEPGRELGDEFLRASNNDRRFWTNVTVTPIGGTGTWASGANDGFSLVADFSAKPNKFSQKAGAYARAWFSYYPSAVAELKPGPGVISTAERVFERGSQVADCSHYTELTKSNESGPEHEIVWVNEYIPHKNFNDGIQLGDQQGAGYDDMTTIGLALKTTGAISGVEQLRVWSGKGIAVERLRSGLRSDRASKAPSNNFADLIYYLLTSKTQGVGGTVPSELVDTASLEETADFLYVNKIFFDGVLEDSESFRSFLYDTAPLQLCTFTIKNGKFGLQPALPFFKKPVERNGEIVRKAGEINDTTAITVEQIFTAGNIIENSLQLQYIDVSQRSNIRALVTWRTSTNNELPSKISALVHWADIGVNDRNTTEQSFDLSEFCTNREQALRTARFLLSVRRRITKTVSFKTVPDALGVQPGSYIRVITEASTYSSSANGVVTDAGDLVSISPIESGTYDAIFYFPSDQRVEERKIVIETINGRSSLIDATGKTDGALFTLLSNQYDRSVYQIESLNLEEDGLVSISAVEVPTDASGVSIVAKDVLTPGNFTVLE